MQEVVYLRLELAKALKQVNSFVLREMNHRRRE
jgi:hypothetical protein